VRFNSSNCTLRQLAAQGLHINTAPWTLLYFNSSIWLWIFGLYFVHQSKEVCMTMHKTLCY
jgi:hypothetical protein